MASDLRLIPQTILAAPGSTPPSSRARTSSYSSFSGKQFCGDDRVAEFMPGFVEGSPLGKADISPANYRQFLEFMLGKICAKTGYKVERFEKRGGQPSEGER